MNTDTTRRLLLAAGIALTAGAAEAARAYKAKPEAASSFPALSGHPILTILVHFGVVALVVMVGALILAALTKPPPQE
jgi:hypothetical protein